MIESVRRARRARSAAVLTTWLIAVVGVSLPVFLFLAHRGKKVAALLASAERDASDANATALSELPTIDDSVAPHAPHAPHRLLTRAADDDNVDDVFPLLIREESKH